ncbi:hypothetical protein [Demequina salsinemoris]|uniref:hypothetical protein n=1 Tax=Demequina salsinemoris TaxID=577470 RepID=UPI0007821486|nr:hypothetical protein [Demequina salsinemoris]
MRLAPKMIVAPAVALLAAGMLAGCGDTEDAEDTMEPTATHDEMMSEDSMTEDSMEDDTMTEDSMDSEDSMEDDSMEDDTMSDDEMMEESADS